MSHSQIIRVNISLILSLIACASVIYGVVTAVNKRDNDVSNLRVGLDAITTELRSVKIDSRADHETLVEIRRDMKWLVGNHSGETPSTAASAR